MCICIYKCIPIGNKVAAHVCVYISHICLYVYSHLCAEGAPLASPGHHLLLHIQFEVDTGTKSTGSIRLQIVPDVVIYKSLSESSRSS